MNSPAFRSWSGALLLLGAVRLLGAEPAAGVAAPAELKLTAQFDQDGDGRLNAAERRAARAWLARHPASGPATVRPGLQPEQEAPLEPVKPGEKITPPDGASPDGRPLYETHTLRTLFLNFEERDWEDQLADFARTDVQVPAQLLLDGHNLAGVGVHFRAMAGPSPETAGYKRSLNLRLDYTVAGQNLENQRSLRLAASRSDATFLRTMLYTRVAQEYVAAPEANYVRVVINGEYWGVYVSLQPFDENFIQDNFHTTAGARWTVCPGGNLAYLGDDPAAYRGRYHLESPEDPAAWAALIRLCRVLNQTARGDLVEALQPLLDLDNAIKFLALENTLMNQDGYGSNAGAYGLYLDPRGRFHLIPQDAEVSFRLRPVSDYVEHRTDRSPRAEDAAKKPGEEDKIPKGYGTQGYGNPKDFPRQTGTDLAMLLSYSFINKADSDLDGKVTRDEWRSFARAWFMVMDEDFTGLLTRDQFMTKVRLLVTPPSVADGHTKQTFGRDDPAGLIGKDFFNALDGDRNGELTLDELTRVFDRWFDEWKDPKTGLLTQARVQGGFVALFSQSVFQADQVYLAQHGKIGVNDDSSTGSGGRGGTGLFHFLAGLGGGGGGRALIVFHEQLDPLAGLEEDTQPLLAKLLAEPIVRARYLKQAGDITDNWLTWAKLGPVAKEYHDLIAAEVAKDTHKPYGYEHFVQELDQDTTQGHRDGDESPSLRNFITERHAYLRRSESTP